MTDRTKSPEPVLNHVCLLLIQRHDMVVVEPAKSERYDSPVVKALSHKFEKKEQVNQALHDLNVKYKLSGIFNPSEKIEKIKTFEHEGKTFHVFQVFQNRGNLQLNGNFRFLKINEIVKNVTVDIKGTGECIVLPSLKLALN